jgi:RNA polymerase sigma factor (sigma-70 family)
MSEDADLLRQYAQSGSESAFAELVSRYLPLVYATALRQGGGDEALAKDVAQTVFIDLARKASSLQGRELLAGWLYTSTRLAASKVVRGEQRRQLREQIAASMAEHSTPPESQSDQDELKLVLDEAMSELDAGERNAVLIRFFQGKELKEVGSALGISEDAARMRIARALANLQTLLKRRGVTITKVALGTALATEAVAAIPAGLAAQVVSKAIASAGAPSLAALTTGTKLLLTAAAVLVVATVGLLVKSSISPTPPASVAVPAEGDANAATKAAPRASFFERRQASQANTAQAGPHGPELLLVDERDGNPITNSVIALRGWERGSQTLVERKVRLQDGRCVAPFDPAVGPGYWILTRVDGYADTRLRWQPSRGETIPESYTVRLVRPARISGRVLDPAGNVVAGAEVAFGNENTPGGDAKPEDHGIDSLRATSDAEGRWQMDRIAADIVPYLVGSASHPAFGQSEHISLSGRMELVQQLLEGRFVFQLGQGVALQGIVVDVTGQPVADAKVQVGRLAETGSRDARTGPDGSFLMAGCRLQAQPITASAEGYAPAVLSVKVEPNMQPVKLVLSGGRALRIRVVDSNGQPIAGAKVWYCPWPGSPGPFPQVSFNPKTDADGLVIWEHAPEQDLTFQSFATGYMRSFENVIRPDDQLHTITLTPALVISGEVRDADSGDLLPRFRLGIGCPQPTATGSKQPWWSSIDRFWPIFTGGTFRHSLEELVIGGTVNRGYIFRFEAEGHAPHVTRVYRPDEGEVRLEVKLRKAEETWITVYTPKGEVAANAHIGLVAAGSRLELAPGGFSTGASEGSTWLRKADAKGQFLLPADEAVEAVVLAHEEGYAESTMDGLRKARAIRLQPWARIEGSWQTSGQPVVNGEVRLLLQSASKRHFVLNASSFKATTDAAGRFVFPQVPPGSLNLFTWQPAANQPAPGTQVTRVGRVAARVETRAGETCQVSLGTTNANPNP